MFDDDVLSVYGGRREARVSRKKAAQNVLLRVICIKIQSFSTRECPPPPVHAPIDAVNEMEGDFEERQDAACVREDIESNDDVRSVKSEPPLLCRVCFEDAKDEPKENQLISPCR